MLIRPKVASVILLSASTLICDGRVILMMAAEVKVCCGLIENV